MKLKQAFLLATCSVAAVGLGVGAARAATVYDLADYNLAAPSGPWSSAYEHGADPARAFTTFRPATTSDPIALWWDNSSGANVAENTGSLSYQGSGDFPPLAHTAHPGADGTVAAFVFTAPAAGRYNLDASFFGIDFVGPTDTQVKVVTGSFSAPALFTGTVYGFAGSPVHAAYGLSPSVSFTDMLTLSAGENLFFEVGFDPLDPRATGPYAYDTTGVSVQLAIAAAEPSSIALTLLGFAGLFLAGRKRSRRKGATIPV